MAVEVREAIDELRTLQRRLGADLRLTFEVASSSTIDRIHELIPVSTELDAVLDHGMPCGEFPAFVQQSHLCTPTELLPNQIGYRVDALGDPLAGWNGSWVAIGYDSGDPLIGHIAQAGTPVSVAVHGAGSWRPVLIAPSLGAFYALVGAWSALVIEDFDGSRVDEHRDFEVKAGFWDAFDRRLANVVPADSRLGLRSYLET